jgi:aryl-alcohol dehydrogenase-like predicted oxidoreductase
MQYKYLPNINKPISRLVQGTVMINSGQLDWSFALLDAVFEAGCTAFDSGQSYRLGDCERVLGKWLHSRGVQEQVVILTKGAHHSQDRKRVTPYDITADLHDSLARLRVDTIDLYLLHRDDPSLPVEPIVDILNEHHQAGLIRVFGVSNWTIERIEAANAYAQANGLTPIAVSSPNFSLADQFEAPWPDCISISGPRNQAAQDWYAKNQMPLFVWSSLAGGFFSGRFTRDNLDTFETHLDLVCVKAYGYEENFKRYDRAKQLAEQKGVTVPQIAMAYVLHQPLNLFALVGCNSGAEFAENAAALELQLSAKEMAWLDLQIEDLGA